MPCGCPEPDEHGNDRLFNIAMIIVGISLLLLGAGIAAIFNGGFHHH